MCSLEGAINEFLGFGATFFVDIEFNRKFTSKSILPKSSCLSDEVLIRKSAFCQKVTVCTDQTNHS